MSSNTDNAVLEPHLTDFGRGGTRYPSPFFDLGQQYLPRTTKELFQWCTYFYYTNPQVGAAITKISRYPITDIVLEDEHPKVVDLWEQILVDHLNIKDRHMEINLDLNTYGNAFLSMHFPFTRFLICSNCKGRTNIKEVSWKWVGYSYHYTCPHCGQGSVGDPENNETIKDVPYRSKDDISLVRWNPEHITLRYNEATGNSTYYYTVSPILKRQITEGEKDILEDIPLLFIQAVKQMRIIKLSNRNIYHLKRPTLAEKDMGWGKPLIYHVLKDLYYMAVLRKAQEAIANEHIVPFDFLFPQPNAQVDPFVHTDLGNWRIRIEESIKKHRQDPNYKAILPVPVGFGRIGGQGKALMLTPELDFLNKTIIGGMGVPVEFLYGGLSWSGSSITLRSLQNDFLHNQTQLLKATKWIKEKIRIFLRIPDIRNLRFLDFKMADDVQKNQQLIGLNAANKVSTKTLLTELGLDYEQEQRLIFEEMMLQSKLQDQMARAQAKTSGEAQIIQFNYQQKLQELQQAAMEKEQQKQEQLGYGGPMQGPMSGAESGLAPQGEDPTVAATEPGYQDQNAQPMPQAQGLDGESDGSQQFDVHSTLKTWASKLVKQEPIERDRMLIQIKSQYPDFGFKLEKIINQMLAEQSGQAPGVAGGGFAGQANAGGAQVNMSPLPQNGMPTRAGMV